MNVIESHNEREEVFSLAVVTRKVFHVCQLQNEVWTDSINKIVTTKPQEERLSENVCFRETSLSTDSKIKKTFVISSVFLYF